MAEVFAPFTIQRTIRNLTFYMMEDRNFVRKKSSLTRRKVLYAPQFKNTRHYAGLMAKASKLGSVVFNQLPDFWRQGWMYRSFTGEAFKMLKSGKSDQEIKQVLYECYVKDVVNKLPAQASVSVNDQPKRTYHKQDFVYWKNKTDKSIQKKVQWRKLMHNASLLARASKVGSYLYRCLPDRDKKRCNYQRLTGWAMQLLKQEYEEADIVAALLPTLPPVEEKKDKSIFAKSNLSGVIRHLNGRYYLISSLHKRNYSNSARLLPFLHQMSYTKLNTPL